jgi:AraC-like DNA-binding protein
MGLVVAPLVSATEPLELPRRQNRLVIDGDLDDWRGPFLEIQLADTDVPPPLGNTGVFRLVWDADHLWFGVEITDGEVYAPPESIDGASLYQWDSIELYIDGHGDRSERMDENDTQFIVSCDGRYGAMQGDELLRSVEDWEIPKRERLGLAARTAARRTATGYVVEGAFPLAAVDLAQAGEGQTIALDLAWNDWIEDHPRLPELLKDLENLALLTRHESESEVAYSDPDSLGWDGLLDWEERAYRPLSWCSGPDFGRPPKWSLVVFSGRAPWTEVLVERWGLVPLLAATFVVLLAVALVVDFRLRSRYHRRLRELMSRIDDLSEPAAAVPSDPRDWVTRVTQRLAEVMPEGEPTDDAIGRVLFHVRDHMGEPLSVGDVALGVGVSPRTLQRVCRDEFGASPRDVILAVKMRSAREALAGGRLRVHEVAAQVGFDSPYHFSRRFKAFYGEPPSSVIPPRHSC